MIAGSRSERPILVVEDYDDIRSMVRIFLETNGFDVVEAADGLEAVEVAEREKPQLILMDLRMPVLDGVSAVQLIRKIEAVRDVPIVIVTGDGDLGRELFLDLEGLGAGRIEYLVKPINEKGLLALVNDLIRKGGKNSG